MSAFVWIFPRHIQGVHYLAGLGNSQHETTTRTIAELKRRFPLTAAGVVRETAATSDRGSSVSDSSQVEKEGSNS